MVHQKIKHMIILPYDLAIHFGYIPKIIESGHSDICISMLIAALFTIAKVCVCRYRHRYKSALKKNETQRGKMGGGMRDGLGVWEWQMHTLYMEWVMNGTCSIAQENPLSDL